LFPINPAALKLYSARRKLSNRSDRSRRPSWGARRRV